MKKILITGSNSYVGTNLVKWLENYPDMYSIDSISLRNDSWKKEDFSKYDVVFHVAGIAHVKETKENKNLYYKINRDLAYITAKKAKKDGVRQFIFLSSMSVYGIENGVINKNTPLNPRSNYGISKLQAEELIRPLEDEKFKISIIRPPMIYGKGCKGNYTRLASLAVKVPVFPDIDNNRSMIYIDNFSRFTKILIDECRSGLFFPQNVEYVKTSEMVKMIADIHGKNIWMTKLFNPIIKVLKISTVNKVFGDLVYDKSLTENINTQNTSLVDLKESIKMTE